MISGAYLLLYRGKGLVDQLRLHSVSGNLRQHDGIALTMLPSGDSYVRCSVLFDSFTAGQDMSSLFVQEVDILLRHGRPASWRLIES